MATLTLTPDPDATPPSVLVEVEAQTDGVISSIELTRDGVPVLGSPLAGFSTATYTDYSAPYGKTCSYHAVGVESVQVWPALWSEAWGSLASWTGSDWSVSAGSASSEVFGATITRAAANFGKITVADPHYVRLELLSAGGSVVGSVACTTSMVVAGTTSASIATVAGFSVWVVGYTLFVSTATESTSVPIPTSVASVRLVALPSGVEALSWNPGYPRRVAVDASSNVYVANTSEQIRKYSSAGTLITSWSTTGEAYGVAVDSSSNVYVTDATSNLIRKYTSTGTPITSWSAPIGSVSTAIAVDSSSNVYLTDTASNLIRKYTSTGTPVTSWSTTDTPVGIAVDSSSNVYVSTGSRLIRKYTSTGTPVTSWSTSTSGIPYGIAVDASSNVYVAYYAESLIRKYTSTGTLITSWSAPNTNNGLAIDSSGSVYFNDYAAKLVRKYNQVTAGVGAIATYTTATAVSSAFDISATTTVNPTSSWLIHPKTPALSVQIGLGDSTATLNIEKDGIGDASRETQAGRQRAAGATEDAVFTVGNRSAPALTVTGYTDTEDAASALKSLFTDESAVMLRFPPSWSMPFEERWYSVGTYTEAIIGTGPERRWTLPLTPAATPYVVVQPVWSEAALVLAYPTEAAYIAAFATEYDKLVNNPRG